MKKALSVLLALVLAVTVLAGCGEKKEQPSGIYYDLTGIAPDEIVMTVGGEEIPADLYFYWAVFNANTLEQQIRMYNSYLGMYEELLDKETNQLKWDGRFSEEQTLGEFLGTATVEAVESMVVIEQMAQKNGVVFTEKNQEVYDQQKAALVEKLGGQEQFDRYLRQIGVDEETFTRINQVAYLLDGLKELVLQEGSALYLDPAGFDQYLVYADHILISTMDENDQPLPEEEKADKLKLAQDILSQLRASDDPITLFTQLADKYSEDPGHEGFPMGYVFGEGEMVKPFEDTAFALKVGEISDIVESEFGYHIILRRDLQEGLENDQEHKNSAVSQHLNSILTLETEKLEVEAGQQLEGFDYADFYVRYSERIKAELEALEAEKQAAEETPESGETDQKADEEQNTEAKE